MTKHQWTCKNCETPNVLVYDETADGQHTLNCGECGAPGMFDPISQSIIYTGLPSDLTASTITIEPYNINHPNTIVPYNWRG
jgi:hypothetical protein